MGQPGFFDLDRRLEAISAKGDPLQALNALVPFESFRAEIEAVVRLASEERKSNAGRKPFDARSAVRSDGCGCAFHPAHAGYVEGPWSPSSR